MRKIKFRGLHNVTNEWVYGDLEHLSNGIIHIFSNHYYQPVIESSVGQFTGLTDRNGKEIYEYDIITVKGQYPRIVLWDKVSWALMPVDLYHDKHFWEMNLQHPDKRWWEDLAKEIEVIGNIHNDKIKEE